MMRKLFRVVGSPIVEPLLAWIEHGVTIEDHKTLMSSLQKDIDKLQIDIQRYLSPHTLNVEHEFNCNLFETRCDLQYAQLACLLDRKGLNGGNSDRLNPKFNDFVQTASWKGSRVDIARARIVSSTIFFSLHRKVISAEQAIPVVTKLINGLPTEAWCSLQGVLYGSSYLLRTLSMLCQMGYRGTFLEYVEDVYERILRRVEIKRQRAFQFQHDSIPLDASYILEQLRFTLAMLDAASLLLDVRYLNAALKMNDWNYKSIKKFKIPNKMKPKNLIAFVIGLYYLEAIQIQETLFIELCQS